MKDLLEGTTVSVNGGPQMPLSAVREALDQVRSGRARTKRTPEDVAEEERVLSSAGEEIRSFVERAESLEAQRKDLAEELKEVFAEAKGRGYDVKILRKIIALRKRNQDDVAEEEAILDLYKQALGMA